MPQNPSPPYASGAISIPRTLIRWLDVNAQNGPLTRTSTYITLPSFNVNVSWLGFSDIIAAFNFEGPNNFSLIGGNMEPSPNPNYVLCVIWMDINHVTHRYALWNGVGETIYGNIPLYTGQVIMKNFRFEVWSTNVVSCVQTTPINFYTTVAGQIDYRYGTDNQLVSSDPIVTSFSVGWIPTQELTPPLSPSGITLYNWFRADSNISGEVWTPKQGTGFYTGVLTNSSNIVVSNNPYIKNSPYITNIGADGGTNSLNSPNDIWLLFQYIADDFDGYILYITTGSGTSILSISSGVLSTDGHSFGNIALKLNHWYILRLSTTTGGSNSILTIWPITQALTSTNYQFTGVATSNTRLGAVTMIVGEFSNINVADIIIYGGAISGADLTTMINYWNDRYIDLFALPLTFPPNTVPQTNIINPVLTPNQKVGAPPSFSDPNFTY